MSPQLATALRKRTPKKLPRRAVKAAEWLIEGCRRCPQGYGMDITFGVTDCPDILLVLLRGLQADLKTRGRK